jgi:hypothetical protein
VETPKARVSYSASAYAFRAAPAAVLQLVNWESLAFLPNALYGAKMLVPEMPPAMASPFRECVPRDSEQLEQGLVWQPSVFEQQVFA